jgi:integration host factor subunit beta
MEWRKISMTKADLVERIASRVELSKKDSETVVNTVFHCIVDALAQGDKVELRGFGSFRTRKRNPRIGRNPKTGDKVEVPAKKVPFFKPGKNLKKLVNE